eukprot:783203-Amphidinium_carterae.1
MLITSKIGPTAQDRKYHGSAEPCRRRLASEPASQPASQPACLPAYLPACPLTSPSMGRQCPRGRGATRVAVLNIQTFINYESTERANFHKS